MWAFLWAAVAVPLAVPPTIASEELLEVPGRSVVLSLSIFVEVKCLVLTSWLSFVLFLHCVFS